MTPVDYLQNPASAVGIPNINLGDATSAMSQIMFQDGGARHLGSNGNQPLITNQNDFQIFDNVTRVLGRQTLKAGGSLTLRSREILNADSITGQFFFNGNQTSSCAGVTVSCTPIANTGFDVASFLLGTAIRNNRALFDAKTYTEKRPEIAAYVQDDFRVTNRLTVNAGLRWTSTCRGSRSTTASRTSTRRRQVRRRLGRCGDRGHQGRPVSADVLEARFRTALRVRVRRQWQRPHGRSWRLRRLLEFHARRHLIVEGAESAIPPDHHHQHDLRHQHSDLGGLPPPPGVHPEAVPTGSTRSAFDVNFRDGYAHNFNVNVQRQFGTNYMAEVRTRESQGRNMALKIDFNQAPPILGVTNPTSTGRSLRRRPAWRRSVRCRARDTSATTGCS